MTTDNKHFISIVVPVYNEEESLPLLHQQLTQALSALSLADYEIIFVDDGSTDQSYAQAQRLYEEDVQHVHLIKLRRNFGQTAAMAAGFHAAQGDIIFPIDADLQNDPNDIGRMIDKMDEGYDVVSGWRADRKDKFLSRRLPSILANQLISTITGVHLHDYGCTLKAYHRDVVQHMRFYGEMHRFLPALASWSGATITELPVNHRERQFGTSKYGISRTLRVVLDLLTVKFLLSYATRPMQVFGKFGIIMMALGVGSGLFSLVQKVFPPHQDVTASPWMYICIFLMLGGLQLLSIGLLGEINIRTYFESQGKTIYTIREEKKPAR